MITCGLGVDEEDFKELPEEEVVHLRDVVEECVKLPLARIHHQTKHFGLLRLVQLEWGGAEVM